MLSPNAAFLDGKSFEYKNGETNGETTKMTFFGPSGEVLKFWLILSTTYIVWG